MAAHAPCRGGSTALLQLVELQRRQHPQLLSQELLVLLMCVRFEHVSSREAVASLFT